MLSEERETHDVACLGQVGALLTEIWCGVLSLTDEQLQIDEDDREDLMWWLTTIQQNFAATTRRENEIGKKGSDLFFEFDAEKMDVVKKE